MSYVILVLGIIIASGIIKNQKVALGIASLCLGALSIFLVLMGLASAHVQAVMNISNLLLIVIMLIVTVALLVIEIKNIEKYIGIQAALTGLSFVVFFGAALSSNTTMVYIASVIVAFIAYGFTRATYDGYAIKGTALEGALIATIGINGIYYPYGLAEFFQRFYFGGMRLITVILEVIGIFVVGVWLQKKHHSKNKVSRAAASDAALKAASQSGTVTKSQPVAPNSPMPQSIIATPGSPMPQSKTVTPDSQISISKPVPQLDSMDVESENVLVEQTEMIYANEATSDKEGSDNMLAVPEQVIESVHITSTDKVRYCPECGKKNIGAFCTYCGAKVEHYEG